MKPTEILMTEHRVIEQVLDCLDRMAEQCRQQGRIDPGPARDALAFFRNFADQCHHGKEEAELFPMLESKGFSADSGPTAVMRNEHVQGRDLLRRLDASIEGAAAGHAEQTRAFTQHALAYTRLLREHIDKEDHCLFPMAEQSLTAQDQELLLERFNRVEHAEIGVDLHEKYRRMADELAQRFGVERAQVTAQGCGRPGSD